VVPLDDDAEWYRYHRLFRDMLRAEAMRLIPNELAALHRRASGWHRLHGTSVEAVRHALAAGDTGLAGDLVKANWFEQGRSGHQAIVWSWLDALPREVTRSDPHLCAVAAYLLTRVGDFDAAGAWLARVPDDVPPGATPLPDGFASVSAIKE